MIDASSLKNLKGRYVKMGMLIFLLTLLIGMFGIIKISQELDYRGYHTLSVVVIASLVLIFAGVMAMAIS